MMAFRARWHVAALLAIYALPILGITVYFTLEELRGLAAAQSERDGLRQIAAMDNALFALASSGVNLGCGIARTPGGAARADEAMGSPAANKPFNVREWHEARAQWKMLPPGKSPDPVMASIGAAVAQISDRSGLTFDSQVGAVDLSDALTYRLPQAFAALERARYDECNANSFAPLSVRLDLVSQNAQAKTLLTDAFYDVDDARENGGIDSSDLAALNASVQNRVAGSSAALQQYVLGNGRARDQALFALDASMNGLSELMQAAIPQIDAAIGRHIIDHRRRMGLAIAEGLTALLAAAFIGLLLTRLIYQYAALTAAQRLAAESEHRAMHDPLTGLLNRRAFLTSGTNVGVLCIADVDNLKSINDAFGHNAGDSALVHVAKVLQSAVRVSDPVARLGGDEFAILLREPVERDAVDRILETVFLALSEPFSVGGRALRISVSIGTAAVGERTSLEEAFARADEALYRAKRQSRGGATHAGFRSADA